MSEVLRLALPPAQTVAGGPAGLGRGIFWARLLGRPQGLLAASETGEMVLLPASAVARSFGRVVRDLGEAGVEAVLVSTTTASRRARRRRRAGHADSARTAPVSLIDVERAIISLIVDRESQLRRRVEQIYERLLATLVDDAGIAALAAEVADVTRRPTIVLDEYFRVQVAVPDDETHPCSGRSRRDARDARPAGARCPARRAVLASTRRTTRPRRWSCRCDCGAHRPGTWSLAATAT